MWGFVILPIIFFELIWFHCHSPKMGACLLRALQSKLLTRDLLKSYGIPDSDTCYSLSCPSRECTSFILWVSLFNVSLGSLQTEIGTLCSYYSFTGWRSFIGSFKIHIEDKSTVLAKVALSATVWHIWKEISSRIFQLQEHNKIFVFRKLYENVRILLRTCNWKLDRKHDMIAVLSNWDVC